MNARQARQILHGYRPSGEDDDERTVREALKVATKNPTLEAEFRNQVFFDRALAEKLDVDLPEDLATALEETARRLEGKRCRKLSLRDPAVIAVALAFVILVGLLAWMKLGSFAGTQETVELVQQGEKAGPDQFQALETPAGALPDWFMVQEFEGFVVPKGMESAPVIGARTFKYDDAPVASAAVAKPKSLWYVFEANPFGISIRPGQWKVVTFGAKNQRALAITQVGNMAFVIALTEGGKAELQKYLDSLPPTP